MVCVCVCFVTQYKYLGTIIDNHLFFKKNFNHSFKCTSTQLRLLECFRPYLTVDATMKVYLSMIVPIVTYSSTTCSGENSENFVRWTFL